MFETLCAIALCVLGYYLTFGLMAIGFATIVSGTRGASAAARFWFAQPISWFATGAAWLTGQTLMALGQLIQAIGKLIITAIVDPLLIAIGRLMRIVFFPRR